MVKTGTCWVILIVSYKPLYQTWSTIGGLCNIADDIKYDRKVVNLYSYWEL